MGVQKKFIDASKAKFFIADVLDRFGVNVGDKMADSLIKTIDALPAENVKEMKFECWVEWWPGDCALIMTGEEMLYRCSNCDAKYPDVDGFNFCPHCGNPMEGKAINVKIPAKPEIRPYAERKGGE